MYDVQFNYLAIYFRRANLHIFFVTAKFCGHLPHIRAALFEPCLQRTDDSGVETGMVKFV